jgi:phenylalanyl-tRNA synthetase alpha subunit
MQQGVVDMQHGVVDMQVRSQFRKIFVAMGFEEMMTNAYVENRCALGKEPVL